MRNIRVLLSAILMCCVMLASCKTTQRKDVIGTWKYTKGDKHIWPEKIIFLRNGQMKGCEGDHVSASVFKVLNEHEIHLFLSKEKLNDHSISWTPYLYYKKEGILSLCTPDGKEGIYVRDNQ